MVRSALTDKSTITVYEKWQLDPRRSLRFYYLSPHEGNRRKWLIKNKNPQVEELKNEEISEERAAMLIVTRQPTFCVRYWDQTTKKATRIEQLGTTMSLKIGDNVRTLSESFKSLYKRITK